MMVDPHRAELIDQGHRKRGQEHCHLGALEPGYAAGEAGAESHDNEKGEQRDAG
jgi:hypothetical protein